MWIGTEDLGHQSGVIEAFERPLASTKSTEDPAAQSISLSYRIRARVWTRGCCLGFRFGQRDGRCGKQANCLESKTQKKPQILCLLVRVPNFTFLSPQRLFSCATGDEVQTLTKPDYKMPIERPEDLHQPRDGWFQPDVAMRLWPYRLARSRGQGWSHPRSKK